MASEEDTTHAEGCSGCGWTDQLLREAPSPAIQDHFAGSAKNEGLRADIHHSFAVLVINRAPPNPEQHRFRSVTRGCFQFHASDTANTSHTDLEDCATVRLSRHGVRHEGSTTVGESGFRNGSVVRADSARRSRPDPPMSDFEG